ncbi:protein SZT2 [Echinococcus multilocularis]|uniref:Protein SZT2 n=1 Tax=Echinococcus multilocularis TaxID=6211 RepID=A0A068Y7X4_ECHMU|nr:protein SZT2 [Echinococcus multilocularis]
MTSNSSPETEIPADTVYVLAKPGHKVSHNTRVEWFIGNVNRHIVFPASGVCAQLPDWPADCAPASWSSLSIVAALPSPPLPSAFPISYCIHPHTTVKYLAHSHRITFVLDLSDSMLQPCSTGFSVLYHAVFCLESVLYKLIPPSSGLSLPLPNSFLSPLSLFISIIGVVPNRQSFTLIHDWEASLEGIKSVIAAVNKRLFQLETADLFTLSYSSSSASALVDMLRHGVLTLAMQMPDWAPASLIIISDACFTTLDMVELDRCLAHLRAAAIRCSFIVPSTIVTSTVTDFAPARTPRNLLRAISTSPCIPQLDLCQFIAHATAGFCLTGLSTDRQYWSRQNSSQWNQIHELLLALRLQDDVESTPDKEGDLGWVAINEIQPYSRIVHAALNHVLASRLKDGYRLRSVSVPPAKNDSVSPATSSSWIQIELALAWKPGVVFRLFLAGEWFLPTGQLPVFSSNYYLLQAANTSSRTKPIVSGRYCIANLRVRANCSLLRAFTQQRRDQVTSSYLASTLNRFDFHFRLLNLVDDYLENVSSFNLNPDIYSVPVRYKNGLCSVYITAQGASGGSEIYLSGNTAEEMEHDKSLFNFVYYWGRLLTLDIANCYRWMHSKTLYVVLEHDSPLPTNLFIPVPTRRVTDLLTCRQSLARIHSMLSDWCTFVLLENHTYIRLEYPSHESLEDTGNPEASEAPLSHASSLCVPCYFTLVRLEMKLPEMRVRVAFTAGVQSDYRRATLEQLSRRFRVLSFLPRGRQAVPKSRHKSGTFGPLYPFSLNHAEDVHVPPLQRSWGETPCCMVFLSQLDRLIVETGTWMSSRQQNYRTATQPSSSNFQVSKSFLKGTVTEARCEVTPVLLRQHLSTSGCIWVAPVVSKSPNCVAKMFSTLMNLRIQEGFHFVRSGPQPGFVSMAREVMFSVDSAAEGAIKRPCLIQYQLYPFRVKTARSDQSRDASEMRTASEAVQKVLDAALASKVPRLFVNRLKALTSAQLSSEIQIATEVWIEPKHGYASDLPTEALYLANLPYAQVVERILQLDCFCLAAYSTLEKILTACLLRIIELQRLAVPPASPTSNESQTTSMKSLTTTTSNSSSSTAPAVALPFNLANITAVCPRMCLLYPLLLDASMVQETTAVLKYLSSENVITRLIFNLTQRMPYITPIHLSSTDSDQFNHFLVSEETEENAPRLNRALLESGEVEWQCFATIVSFIETMSGLGGGENRSESQGLHPLPTDNFVEVNSVEIGTSPVTFFVLPANMKVATSSFCQDLMNNLRRRLGDSNRHEPSFPIFIYSCTHTYLSFPLDDRWTYNHPDTLIIDFFKQNKDVLDATVKTPRLICREELTSNPPDGFLAAAKGNPRLTTELGLLWARLRDASLGLLNLCDEAFVECAHRTLLHGLVVSEEAIRSVLTSERFCSSLPPITIDATEFLCSTCSHCFNAIRNQMGNSGSQNLSFFPCKKKSPEGCELRPHDGERIRGRLFSVLNQYFSPITQFPGFYYFRGGDEITRPHVHLATAQRCDTWPIPTTKSTSHILGLPPKYCIPQYRKLAEVSGSQVMFPTSLRSESDTEEVKKKECGEAMVEEKGDGTAAALLYPNEVQPMPYRKPLFLKAMLKLKHGGEEVKLPVENLPICLLDALPSSDEVNLQELSLNVIFTPLIWKPKVGIFPSDANAESPGYQESPAIATGPGGHLDPVKERSESFDSSSDSDSEEFSTFSEAGDGAFNTNILQRSLPLPPSKIHPSRHAPSTSSEVIEDGDFLCSLHWCECHLEISEAAGPCSICGTFSSPEFLRYLDNEQWISLRRTTQIFRWLLQDEVVCSQRLLQPLLVSTVEAVLRHMENTKFLLLNSVPSSSVLMPFHISHSYALLSKTCISGAKGANSCVSGVLLDLMRAIGWESVGLEFIVESEKSVPRFLDRLQSISFRYSQAQLNHIGDYYVVCRAEPLHSPFLSSSPQEEKHEQHPLVRSTSEAGIFVQLETECLMSNASETQKVTSRSMSLPSAPQPALDIPECEISDDSAEVESLTSKTRASSFASLERQPTIATTTDAETDVTRFPLASQFPPQDSLNLVHQISGPSLPAFWLIFRVGSASIQAFFHHSDTHREPSAVEDACPHCVVFRRALDDIRSTLRLVSQSLLLDQLVLDHLCDSSLLPEPLEPPKRPPRNLQTSATSKRKPLVPTYVHSRSVVISASSATDSDNTEVQPMVENPLRKKSLPNEITSVSPERYPPGSLACPPKFVFSMEVSPRAVIAGERGNQVLPELRRLLENFAVMNRKNMFVFDDSEPASDTAKPAVRRNFIPRIFYMLLREVPLESSPAFETPRRTSPTSPSRRESLPLFLGSSSSSLNRIQLQATLHGINSPSRHFCNFVRTLLQSLLDKIVLQCLQQVLSRTVLFRFASHDFDFLFARRGHLPRHQLFFTLPRFLTDSSKVPHFPRGTLIFPFCQYLKQNLLTFMTAAKPEREVLSCLRNRFGCVEVMLYYRRRGVGTAKFGLVTAVVDLLQAGTQEPFCITSCLDLQEWLRRQEISENTAGVASMAELVECLTDLQTSHDTVSSSPDRLAVRLRLWERGEVDLKLLTEKLHAAVQNALYDLIMEYFVLGLPACLIEVPVFKSRSSDMPYEAITKTGAQTSTYFVPADSIRMSGFFSHTLLPWLGVTTSTQLPPVIERKLQLASLQSIDLLVDELVHQLNALVEERLGCPANWCKCPLLSTSTPPNRGGRIKSTTIQQQLASMTCPCQQCINFFAFEAVDASGEEWMKFSKRRTFKQKGGVFVQPREFVIVGKNHAVCRYEAAFIRSSSGQTTSPGKSDGKDRSTPDEELKIPVKKVSSWSGRVPIQRHQTLELQMQPLPTEVSMESMTTLEDTSFDTSSSTLVNLPSVSSTTVSDVPEFCEMQFCLPQFLFHSSKPSTSPIVEESVSTTTATIAGDGGTSGPCACLQVPRQTLCLIHLRGREVRIYLYNWSRDDADRLLQRVDCLVAWYNQRFQLLSCLSLQKTGLFHCLRTPSHLRLLKQAVHLSDHLCPPELTPTSTVVSVPSASTASRSIRRRLLEGLVGSGAPLQPPSQTFASPSQVTSSAEPLTPPQLPTPSAPPSNASAGISTHSTSPATPSTESTLLHLVQPQPLCLQQQLRVGGEILRDSRDLNLTRIYQNCAQVAALGNTSATGVEYLDVVHLHVDQALRVVKNDWRRAEQLRLITTPLKAWMAGESFILEQYTPMDSQSQVLPSLPPLTTPPLTAFYSAVKRYGRTLHTVCSPFLFCPSARIDALQLRELEQIAEEEGYRNLSKGEEHQKNIGKEERRGHNETFIMEGKSSVPLEGAVQSSPPPKTAVQQRRGLTCPLLVTPSVVRDSPSWMQEAKDCLLQEFITYMTHQMHFTVILSTLDSESPKLDHPYALLQRSVKVAGIHLVEIFIRDCIFCVRLKAIELCRLTRAASRAVLTGPLAVDLVGRAAAVAAVKIASAMIDPFSMTSGGSGSNTTTVNAAVSAAASSSIASSSYVVKWEESSRLCDCVHLHSFLYDFYLRNVDSFLRLQSDLIGQRLQVPNLTWALPQISKAQRRRGGGSFGASQHPFLPANYPVLSFLRDLARIIPLAPVFARGTFTRLPMYLPVDARIKPKQVFEHLIEARQAYGFKAFDLGINSSLPTHARFGFCSFSSPRCPSTVTSDDAAQSLSIHPAGGDNDTSTSSTSDSEMGIVEALKLVPPTEAVIGGVAPLTPPQRPYHHSHSRPPHSTSASASTPRFVPQLRLPCLKHFSLACAAYLDKEADVSSTSTEVAESSTTPQRIGISVFVILTDQCRRFPRARLSSLPHGLSAEHQTPVEWPAIRPGLSSDRDLNILSPKLVRSGSQETTSILAGDSSSALPLSLASGQRCRHTSLNVFALGESTVGTTHGRGRSTMSRTASGEATTLQHDPGLRWKISYLGVWPSHQIELRRALKLVHHTLYLSMPHVINSAILSCHKNLLWYRLFDAQYFPLIPPSTLPPTPSPSSAQEVDEIGQEAVSLLFSEATHRGLSCEEFRDLINSAPLKVDLLRMDPRILDLLNISGEHLASSVVNHLNSSGGKTVAFLFNEANESSSGRTHLVVIDPSFHEGLIHISWRCEHGSAQQTQRHFSRLSWEIKMEQSPSAISKFSSFLRTMLSPMKQPVEGVPLTEALTEAEPSWKLCDFTMRAVFRSADSIEASVRNLSGSAIASSSGCLATATSSTNAMASNFYRAQLMPVLKLIVEILTLHVWRDLH